jgi:hypothetical protein
MSNETVNQKSTSVKTLLNIREDEENYYLGVRKSTLKEIHQNPMGDFLGKVFGNEVLFILLISVFQGLYHIQHLAFFTYKNNHLKISSEIIQLMSGLVTLPWSFKPVFGYLFDKAVVKLNSTKKLIMITCTV